MTKNSKSDRCTGSCCRSFALPGSPEEIKAKQGRVVDGEVIADMIVHIGFLKADPITGELNPPMEEGGIGERDPDDPDGPRLVHFYTCRHLAASGDCQIYERRPRMCAEYPYGRSCEKPDCSWTDAAKLSAEFCELQARARAAKLLEEARAYLSGKVNAVSDPA